MTESSVVAVDWRGDGSGTVVASGATRAAVLLLTAAGALAWVYWPEPSRATPDQLVEQALGGDNPVAQSTATMQLAEPQHNAAPQLRQVLREASHPDVRAAAAQGLGDVQDFQSVPELLRLCDDPSPLVRGRAGAAVR